MSHISAVDGIYHVVRAFPNEEVVHNEGEVNPINDMGIINEELIAKDLQAIEKIVPEIETQIKRTKERKSLEEELDTINRVSEMLKNG